MAKTNLFAYGTLRESDVLVKVIGRDVAKSDDCLGGYEKVSVEINGNTYPAIIKSAKKDVQVCGKRLEIDESDFKKLDEYETNAYKRKLLILDSGQTAWVYVKNGS